MTQKGAKVHQRLCAETTGDSEALLRLRSMVRKQQSADRRLNSHEMVKEEGHSQR